MKGCKLLPVIGCFLVAASLAPASAARLKRHAPHRTVQSHLIRHIRPPHAQMGTASIYARRFQGRRTASGERFSLTSDIAASKTLPLGTRARVTSLKTGRSAVVRIMDRGPHIRGRIVDLTPATARQLGFDHDGVTLVRVEPISIYPVEHG